MLFLQISLFSVILLSAAVNTFLFMKRNSFTIKKWVSILFITLSLASCIGFVIVSNTVTKQNTLPENTPQNTACLSQFDSVQLDTLAPLISNDSSFFIDKWDDFSDITVGETSYSNAIGIKIPESKLQDMYLQSNTKREENSESIDFALRGQYEGMSFSYGVDESSIPKNKNDAPVCICRIIITSNTSESYNQDIILFDSENFDYKSPLHSIYINLNKVDMLRITAYWTFDRDPTKQNALNLAIVDPILYLKES
jgi:hypothetical protein